MRYPTDSPFAKKRTNIVPIPAVVTECRQLPPDWRPQTEPAMPPATRILMVDPASFRVDYAINPHMSDAAGNLHRIDPVRAARQWDELRRTYEGLGYPVLVLPADSGLPDQVFVANPVLAGPHTVTGRLQFLPSRMRHKERAREPALCGEFLIGLGAEALRSTPQDVPLEGHGDFLWFPGRRLLLAGYGFRSDARALPEVAERFQARVLGFELRHPALYHLDTALVPLDPQTALFAPEAFSPEGLQLLTAVFPRLLAVPGEEATRFFAANAHCPDGRHVVIEVEAAATRELLAKQGFYPIGLETSEFRRSGGSVFCMKLPLWPT